jgi:hypothetical protein
MFKYLAVIYGVYGKRLCPFLKEKTMEKVVDMSEEHFNSTMFSINFSPNLNMI